MKTKTENVMIEIKKSSTADTRTCDVSLIAIESDITYGGIERPSMEQLLVNREQLDPLVYDKIRAKVVKAEKELLKQAIKLYREANETQTEAL